MEHASLRKPLFGEEVVMVVWNIDPTLASGVLEDAYAEGKRLERIFNFYDEGSALSRLNRDRELEAPDELLIVVRYALGVCAKTGGRYDISLGKLFSARKAGKDMPDAGCSYRDIRIDGARISLGHEDALVDLGSIAKGYIADKMAEAMMGQGVLDGLVDARGDIRAFGREVIVEVQHPREERALCAARVKGGGIATSGDYRQFSGSFERPHIINARDFISVTTIADSLMEADAYATAIFVSPSGEVDELLSGSGIKAMCVEKDLKIRYHNGFERCIS